MVQWQVHNLTIEVTCDDELRVLAIAYEQEMGGIGRCGYQ